MIRAAFILLLSLLISGSIFAQSSSVHHSQEHGGKLKILSWNMFMLPRLVKFTGKKKRARKIAEELAKEDYHIIVFQEAFHGGARRIIRKALKEDYPYELGPANRKLVTFRSNSGIWILSKIPLEQLGAIRYSQCSGIDCMARKGALLAQGEWNGQVFQVLGTHIQASGAVEVKHTQYEELAENLLKPHHKQGVPQIICGDFNMNQLDEVNYPKMLQALDVKDYSLQGEYEFTSDGMINDLKDNDSRKVIDYIFYKSNGQKPSFLRRAVRVFTKPWNNSQEHLSDHFAVEMEVAF